MRNISTFRKLAPVFRLGLTRKYLLLVGLAIMAACMISPAAAAQSFPVTPITQCGTVIKTPGYYVIKQALQSTSTTVDCIQIAAPASTSILGPISRVREAPAQRRLESGFSIAPPAFSCNWAIQTFKASASASWWRVRE